MLLYLVQHAEAKKEEEDPARGLTEKGMQDITKIAAYAQKLNLIISRIYHSGKTRALQTAQVLAYLLKPGKGISEIDSLAPMDDPKVWADRLSRTKEDVLLVGHLPHLAGLASLLLCGDASRNIVDFKNAGIVCLKRSENGVWSIAWMIVPEMIA